MNVDELVAYFLLGAAVYLVGYGIGRAAGEAAGLRMAAARRARRHRRHA